ncbi:MAG TPA: S1/P1 nuclease [Stellaceae bacterium]|nr:S1/P1 nuclease [Stellaceae bacterium]
MRLIAAAMVLMLALSGRALAWGSEGHRVIAEIAEQYLELETARQVRDLLAIENATTLAAVSTWADEIRGPRRETARWHYVNIPIHPPAGTPARFDYERDCLRSDCVVAAVERFTAVLRDRSAPARERLEALRWVVHFVADLHQPLHASNNDDRGGNDVHVELGGRHMTLHAVWDWGILAPAVGGDERAYALRLVRAISAADLEAWRRGSPAEWATEAYAIAREHIYGDWPHESGALPDSYAETALPAVNEQLEKAGVRLAAVLNEALR